MRLSPIGTSCIGFGGIGFGGIGFGGIGLSAIRLWGRAQVTELDHGEDGGTEQGGGADGEGHVQATSEGLTGRLEQDLPGLAGELPGGRKGAAEGIPGGRRACGQDPGGQLPRRQGAGQLAAVDAGADDTQDGDAQRPAELGGGLGQRRRRPGPLRGAAPIARSVARVSTGASASENTTDPVTRSARPAGPSRVNSTRPAAASPRPAVMTKAGRTRRASTGVSMDPSTDPAEEGSIHSPAASG